MAKTHEASCALARKNGSTMYDMYVPVFFCEPAWITTTATNNITKVFLVR